MLVTALTKILMALLMGAAYFLPTYTPPRAADLGAFQIIAWLVPINEILVLVGVIGAFAAVSLIFAAVNWVINKGRGSG